MKKLVQILLVIFTVSMLTGCDFIKNTFTYREKTEDFVKVLLTEDYEKSVEHFALEHESAKNADLNVLKEGLSGFRKKVVDNFGTELKFSFMNAEKKVSTNKEESTPPNTTRAFIQFSNDKEFGVFKVLFDDRSGKIITINMLDVKEPIPSMSTFWMFGLLALCVPAFNIYVIRQIKKSDRTKKWLKYIAVICLNTPAIKYAAVGGLSFQVVNFQILLGVSFGYMGFLNSYWTLGLPLGGLYWFLRLRDRKNDNPEPELLMDQKIEPGPATE